MSVPRRYGCHNRAPLRATQRVVDGHLPTAPEQRVVVLPFRMSRRCEYTFTDLGQADSGCIGCVWRNTPEPKPPRGYTAEELERDNPYNAWMQTLPPSSDR